MTKATQKLPKINIPISSKAWETEKFVANRIHALNGIRNSQLTFGKKTYKNRTTLVLSVINKLIRLGYDKDEIELIAEENNMILSRVKRYQFDAVYDRAISYIIKETTDIQALWGTQFKFVTDELVYKALVSMGVSQLTNAPEATKTYIRRITGISDQRTVTNSLARLTTGGYILPKLIKRIQTVDGSDNYYKLYKYSIITPLKGNHYKDQQDNILKITGNTLESISYVNNRTIFKDIEYELHFNHVIGRSYSVLIELLTGEKEYTVIAENIGVTKNLLSTYGKKLEDLGIIKRRIEGKIAYYSLTDDYHNVCYAIMLSHFMKNIEKINNERDVYKEWQKQFIYNQLKALKGKGDHNQEEIRHMEAKLDGFINTLLVGDGMNISDRRFYKGYLEWCNDLPMTNKEFWAEMDNIYTKKPTRDGFTYQGVTL